MLSFVRSSALGATLALVSVLSYPTILHAQVVDLGNGWGPSAVEISKLPEYCQKWFRDKALPASCDGVHHLCAGKVLINRTMDYAIPKRERQRIIGHAKTEVDYIFGRSNPMCPVMEEARATQRQVQMMQGLLK